MSTISPHGFVLMRGLEIVGRAVQTDPTLLGDTSATTAKNNTSNKIKIILITLNWELLA